MLVIYIAGPYRALTPWWQERNIRRAEEAAYNVWDCGHVALCPHTNSRWEYARVLDEHWLAGTMELMRRCDAVLVLPAFEGSNGTKAEIAEAERLGKPVAYLEEIDFWHVSHAIAELEATP